MAMFLIPCSLSQEALAGDSCATYREITGNRETVFLWSFVQGDEPVLTTVDSQETFQTRFTPDLQTIAWEFHRPGQKTDVVARRDGGTLAVRGEFEGKALERWFEIGSVPWFQSLSVSLTRQLSQSPELHEFVFLRPDTLEPTRLKVTAVEEEELSLAGVSVATWRVEIRPAGLLSALWHGHYWFRQSDRRFLRFSAASGPPGSPDTEITLVSEGTRQATAQSLE